MSNIYNLKKGNTTERGEVRNIAEKCGDVYAGEKYRECRWITTRNNPEMRCGVGLANERRTRKNEERQIRHDYRRVAPGVDVRLGVPGGLRGVGGGTSVSFLSTFIGCVCISFAARLAASPSWLFGRAASVREIARRRSSGSGPAGRC